MGDIICKCCGEPWEYDYVYHDMTEQERENFMRGRGCPCCKGKSDGQDRTLEFLESLDEGTDLDPLQFM